MALKIKDLLRRVANRLIGKHVRVKNSNSQAGEDRILIHLFKSLGLEKIRYIDIGANHPIIGNNTYIFSKKSNLGVLVEPDVSFLAQIKQARPNDTVLQSAVSTANGTADFFVFDEPSLNTLSRDEAESRKKSGKYNLLETRKINLVTLEKIIVDHFDGTAPHLVSLDVEGIDYEILKSFDFKKFLVPVWVIETCEYSENHIKPKVQVIIDFMIDSGYFVYADTYINTIFVHRDWFNNYKNER